MAMQRKKSREKKIDEDRVNDTHLTTLVHMKISSIQHNALKAY